MSMKQFLRNLWAYVRYKKYTENLVFHAWKIELLVYLDYFRKSTGENPPVIKPWNQKLDYVG